MITPFNRAELLITCDLNRFNQARDALEGAGIDFHCRIKDLASRNWARDGAFAINQDARVEYKLYVRRDQLDWASQVLRAQ